MSAPPFERARSEEQRAERRAAILSAAATMLSGSRVAELSLNGLSREVGLAKSNVLRYFESREAVLLDLYDREYREWLDVLDRELDPEAVTGVVTDGAAVEHVAAVIARTASDRPLLTELAASSATVLEHNVSGKVAADYKHAALGHAARLVGLVERIVGPLGPTGGIAFAGAMNLALGGAWAMCRPSPGMAAAYREHPELQRLQLDFAVVLRELVATVLTGLLHRPTRSDPLD
ncbi:AcrR family transcriptional regulator [Microbacterium resistens]|uniref:AcrR family transcriptional regulator n=1 Tax=Microbacterium resistens TaxID=156977 RepID=A0ABU1SEZ9_9MICO|nr:TetR/AcrR family transcriptional regulator [Microbacterium resistens]MDR6868181.1 AcrR family transcriptional regulator [Microbacterium resistens]